MLIAVVEKAVTLTFMPHTELLASAALTTLAVEKAGRSVYWTTVDPDGSRLDHLSTEPNNKWSASFV